MYDEKNIQNAEKSILSVVASVDNDGSFRFCRDRFFSKSFIGLCTLFSATFVLFQPISTSEFNVDLLLTLTVFGRKFLKLFLRLNSKTMENSTFAPKTKKRETKR